MIERIALKFGSRPGQKPLAFDVTPITVFVGPNNAGKSKLISEMAGRCTDGQSRSGDVILDGLTFKALDPDGAERAVGSVTLRAHPSEVVPDDHIMVGRRGHRRQVHRPQLLSMLQHPNEPPHRMGFAQHYLSYQTLVLDGPGRINLVNDQAGGDLQQPASTTFRQLFDDDVLRAEVSATIHRGLGSYLTVDPTNFTQLRLRLSNVPAPSAAVERSFDSAAVAFHGAATLVADASDGAKAFVGILVEVMAGDPEVLLMDEPEAFLHPALAFTLGKEIGESLAASKKRMFVATHSPQFLMGCIQSGVPINVVRLTYRRGVATARLLPSNELLKLMRNPLLRSTGVISALFYESVVVTEADTDRAFYQEINERLLRVKRGIPSCIFLNAQNKQTIPTIIGPLRRLGIPSAAIYDIDFVKDGKGEATKFMETAGIPKVIQYGLTTMRSSIVKALTAAVPDFKTHGGIDVLGDSEKRGAADYFDQLDSYGAFVIRHGEVESWLSRLGVNGHGPPWLIPMFEKMGEDPGAAGYVTPSDDDVWAFLDRVSVWLLDPDRKGLPFRSGVA